MKTKNQKRRGEKPPKKTKAFKYHLKQLNKRKRHFIRRMITQYEMSEDEAIGAWTRVHNESPEDEVLRMMKGEPEVEDKLPEEKDPDFIADAMVGEPEGE